LYFVLTVHKGMVGVMAQLSDLNASNSVIIAADVHTLYGMIADVTRMGEWSPECKACVWDDGAGPTVGSEFTGYNESDGREWERRCKVVAADPGSEFAWVVGDSTRWGYVFTPSDGGTEVTESWGITHVEDASRLAELTDEQLKALLERTAAGIAATLASLKSSAEQTA
jgi:Polyketide cyclase / dehydrase and lipid transport